MKICRYDLNLVERQTITAPNITPIHFGSLDGYPILWGIADETAEPTPQTIIMLKTDAILPPGIGEYLGTLVIKGIAHHFF